MKTIIKTTVLLLSLILLSCGNSIESDAKKLAKLQCKASKLQEKAFKGDKDAITEIAELIQEAAKLGQELASKHKNTPENSKIFQDALLKASKNCN